MNKIGVVVIGRNEGERLKTCICSLAVSDVHLVYVDSGSEDGSVDFVQSQGFDVLSLDMSVPFSAARARNEGYRYLISHYKAIEFIQFVDGDCEVDSDWLLTAFCHLESHPKVVATCGRRKERFPERTIYNQLCDVEWNTPIGITNATGGDFMCRVQGLVQVNGFSPKVIAGEEPELCFRWRQQGWLIERLDADMTLHDAAITSIKQWWKRCERTGHAYAQGFALHGNSKERYYRKEVIRIVIWCLLPLCSIILSFSITPWALLLLSLPFIKTMQIFLHERNSLHGSLAFFYAASLMFGKFAEGRGVFLFMIKKIRGHHFKIIEYKK
ncbi:MAG: glycosyltransferase involved in cell wall biosynthesis [Candidatus Endobugula sp.]|jgi:glycosyltransferase involved in cell wall biosynthesis